MTQVLIEYDERNILAKKSLEDFLSLPFFKVKDDDECPYDKEFMKKIEASRKSKGKKIKLEELWK